MDISALWKRQGVIFTGGLVGVGFAEKSDFLLALTHSGRGVIDCRSGKLVTRDRSTDFAFDDASRMIDGIGPLVGAQVEICGVIYGGELPRETSDGWLLERVSGGNLSGRLQLSGANQNLEVEYPVAEGRAFGFSPTGLSFIAATGSDVTVYSRED